MTDPQPTEELPTPRPDRGSLRPLEDHLIALPGSEWAFWQRVGLRGAGFPAELVLDLGDARAAAAADRLATAGERSRTVREAALARVDAALDALRAEGAWDDKERRKPLLDAARALRKGKGPSAVEGVLEASATAELAAAEEELATAGEEYLAGYEEALRRQSVTLGRIVAGERFQEAVLWQNRGAFHTALRKILDKPDGRRNSQRRQHEELVASYVQRYTTKNDTIGFFGPMGWARFRDRGSPIEVRPGPELVSRRQVFLESWCLEELATALGRHHDLRPWQLPWRMPFARVDGHRLHLPSQRPVPLTPARAALLRACDGSRTARRIARELVADPEVDVKTEGEVYNLLEQLVKVGVARWGFEVPTAPHASPVLRRRLEAIDQQSVRRSTLLVFGELEAARREVAEAAGDPPRLDRALGRLEDTFERLTGGSATRGAGEIYTGRTLAYEDCLRDVAVELGPEIFRDLAEPLALVLTSARWFTCEVAKFFRQMLREVYRDVAAREGSPVVDAIHVWSRVQPMLLDQWSELLEALAPGLHLRWQEVFGLPSDERRLSFTSAELRERVSERFAAPEAGWQVARCHSPDVLIATSGPEALARGDYHLVLGEVHAASNTLDSWVFMALHPEREQVFAELELDFPEPRLVPIPPKDFPRHTTRTQRAYLSPNHTFLPSMNSSLVGSAEQRLPIAALVVEETASGLRLRTRDGERSFDLLEAFGDLISHRICADFSLLEVEEHQPRITIDRLTVCREAWRFDAGELDFAEAKEGADRFAGARRWARDHGLPRFLFVTAPVEDKPFYLDLESPIYVDLFCHILRRTREGDPEERRIKVSEMLPRTDQAWLPDAEGRLYTSELRVVAVDRARAGDAPVDS